MRAGVVGDFIFLGGGKKNMFSPVLKVPRQWTFVLLVEVHLK
jgi:hypothetical protein